MEQDILSRIRERLPRLSKGQRAIANYILESSEQAALLTAGRLGKAVGVSESTVVRFATELGFDGYPGLQRELRAMVLHKLTAVQPAPVSEDRLEDPDFISAVLESDMERLRRTRAELDRDAFQAAVEALLGAGRIYILGTGATACLAAFLEYHLRYIFRDVRLVTESGAGEMCGQLVAVGAGDVVLALSFPRYARATVRGAGFCRERGAVVVGITDSRESPVGRNADIVLTAGSGADSFAGSPAVPMSLLNALLAAIKARRSRELAAAFDQLEQIWQRYDVYETQGEEREYGI